MLPVVPGRRRNRGKKFLTVTEPPLVMAAKKSARSLELRVCPEVSYVISVFPDVEAAGLAQ
jgi:hypothetical protein